MKSSHLIAALCAAALGSSARGELTTDLVIYYDFEDLTNDPQASGPDATESGTGSYTGAAGGVVGSSAEFTGTTSDFINTAIGFGGSGGDELGNNFSVSAWYNLDTDATSASSRFFVCEGADSYDLSFGLRAADGTYANAQTYTSSNPGTGADQFATYTDIHSQGQWQHVVLTYQSDSTNTTVSTYIDGTLVSTLTEATANLFANGIHIGNARTGALNRPFDGKIDEFAAWKRTLTPVEVLEAHERGLAGIGITTDLASLGKRFVGLAVEPAGIGTTTGTGIYDSGTMIAVSATPSGGYAFDGWSGDFNGQPDSFTHTVTADVGATASFAQDLSDPDNDGLTNYQEVVVYGTLPDNPDSDGDLINDGDEVNSSGTNPNVSDSLAIDYILANLDTGGAGPDDIVLDRNSGNDTVTLKLGAKQSSTLASWSDLLPAGTTSSGASGDGVGIVIPGTAEPARFFRFTGGSLPTAP